jgi:hypothetical protein
MDFHQNLRERLPDIPEILMILTGKFLPDPLKRWEKYRSLPFFLQILRFENFTQDFKIIYDFFFYI